MNIKEKNNQNMISQQFNGNTNIPLETDSIANKLFLSYVLKIIKTGKDKKYQKEDLYKLKDSLQYKNHFKNFFKYYNTKKETKSLKQIMFYWLSPLLLKSSIFFIIFTLLSIAIPICIKLLIDSISSGEENDLKSFKILTFLIFVILLQPFCILQGQKLIYEGNVKIHHIIFGIFFSKFETISLKYIKYVNVGQIISLVTCDLARFFHFALQFHNLFDFPVLLIINSILIIYTIGWVGLLGIGLMLFFTIFDVISAKLSGKFYKEKMKYADQRNKEFNNTITGIKSIKFNNWEKVIKDYLLNIRQMEKGYIFKLMFISVFNNLSSFIKPIFAVFVCISIKKITNEPITLSETLFVLVLFNMFIQPIRNFCYLYRNYTYLYYIFERINHILKFSDFKEKDKKEIIFKEDEMNKGEIMIESGEFSYDDKKILKRVIEFQKLITKKKVKIENYNESKIYPVLKDINLKIKSGEFVAVIGEVGAGKSTLLKAITNSLFKNKGKIKKAGKIAYIPQKGFLINNTIKENITFGSLQDDIKLNKIIKICELEPDLKILKDREYTEIGERGINLSGGQKQRVNIARALFSDSDIFLIDDSLSALDSYVGQKIFKNVFKNYLKDKTKVMVTHSLECLNDVDRIIFMEKGIINDDGSYEELFGRNKLFKDFVNDLNKKEDKKKKKIPKKVF